VVKKRPITCRCYFNCPPPGRYLFSRGGPTFFPCMSAFFSFAFIVSRPASCFVSARLSPVCWSVFAFGGLYAFVGWSRWLDMDCLLAGLSSPLTKDIKKSRAKPCSPVLEYSTALVLYNIVGPAAPIALNQKPR